MARQRLTLALLALSAMASCKKKPAAPRVHLAAAISLRGPVESLVGQWRRQHPEVTVVTSFGASGDLAAQAERGAPIDLVASASEPLADHLAAALQPTRACVLGTGELVLIRRRDAGLAELNWRTLTSHPGLRRLALGATPSVPAGVYAEAALDALRMREGLQSKIVRASNVRGVLDLVVRGEADAGFVYATDVTPNLRAQVEVVGPAPPEARPVVRYPLVVLGASEHAREARMLATWLCGVEGRRAFAQAGFGAPP